MKSEYYSVIEPLATHPCGMWTGRIHECCHHPGSLCRGGLVMTLQPACDGSFLSWGNMIPSGLTLISSAQKAVSKTLLILCWFLGKGPPQVFLEALNVGWRILFLWLFFTRRTGWWQWPPYCADGRQCSLAWRRRGLCCSRSELDVEILSPNPITRGSCHLHTAPAAVI